MRRSISACAVIVALFSAAVVHADAAEHAKTLYNEGLDLRDNGDHAGAKKMFEAALARVRSPIVALDLAREHAALGEVVAAQAVAESIAKIPVAAEETEKSTVARAEAAKLAAELEKRVAVLQIVTGPALIVIDGVHVDPVDAARRRVDPGKHTVHVGLSRYDVDLKEGEVKRIVVDVPASPVVAPIAPAPAKNDVAPPRYTLTYVGLATAGAGLAVGTITGILALSRADSARDKCDADGRCSTDVSRDVSAVRTLGTISTISFAVSGAGLILAAFGYTQVHESKHATVRPWIGVASAGLSGSF
jgi:hypothetical protein